MKTRRSNRRQIRLPPSSGVDGLRWPVPASSSLLKPTRLDRFGPRRGKTAKPRSKTNANQKTWGEQTDVRTTVKDPEPSRSNLRRPTDRQRPRIARLHRLLRERAR